MNIWKFYARFISKNGFGKFLTLSFPNLRNCQLEYDVNLISLVFRTVVSQFRDHRRETCSTQETLLSLSTNALHILYHVVTDTTTGTGFSPVRPLNAFWNKMLPVYLMWFNTDNVFVQRKFIINFYTKLKLSSSNSLRRAYYSPPDCLRCDWQGNKKVNLRFPNLLSYPILSYPILSPFPFVPTLSYSFSTLCYHALLTLSFPTQSYLTPSHPFPSHSILSHPPIVS